jgi:hypothetical protein
MNYNFYWLHSQVTFSFMVSSQCIAMLDFSVVMLVFASSSFFFFFFSLKKAQPSCLFFSSQFLSIIISSFKIVISPLDPNLTTCLILLVERSVKILILKLNLLFFIHLNFYNNS